MTIGDAIAINTLLAYLRDGQPFDDAEGARDAAIVLAEHAYRTLRSGMNGAEVAGFWDLGGPGAETAALHDVAPQAHRGPGAI